MQLIAGRHIDISGNILANGGDGNGFRRTGGGGSGGMIVLRADSSIAIARSANISVRGDCAWMGASGGGGGGGRVVIETRSLRIACEIQQPGKIEESSQLTAAGGQGGYYAIDAINNGQPGADGSRFFSQIQ